MSRFIFLAAEYHLMWLSLANISTVISGDTLYFLLNGRHGECGLVNFRRLDSPLDNVPAPWHRTWHWLCRRYRRQYLRCHRRWQLSEIVNRLATWWPRTLNNLHKNTIKCGSICLFIVILCIRFRYNIETFFFTLVLFLLMSDIAENEMDCFILDDELL